MSESFPDGNPSASPGQASSATWSPGVRPGAARPILTAEPLVEHRAGVAVPQDPADGLT